MQTIYDNVIDIPEAEDIKLEEYFEFRPYCGETLPGMINSFFLGCIFPYNNDRDNARIEFTPLNPENHNNTFRLAISYYLVKPENFTSADKMNWIEEAHFQIQQLFEGCITDRLREIFQEVK